MRARTDPELKARALELARQHGAAEASRETGVSASTIRAWVSRAKADAEPVEVATSSPADDDLARMVRTMAKAKATAEELIDRIADVASAARSPQSLALATGILLTKAEEIGQQLAEQREREVRIAEQDAAWLMAAFSTYMEALGLPWAEGGAARKCWAAILRGGDHGVPFQMPPEADIAAVRAELLDKVRVSVEWDMRREQREREQAEQRARRALPPPAEPEPEPDPEPEAEAEPEVETVSGEVVDEPRRDVHNPRGGWMGYMHGPRVPGT